MDRKTDKRFELLKLTGTMPLEYPVVNMFLYCAADLVLKSIITIDDWSYLARLINFKMHKHKRKMNENTHQKQTL